MAFFTGGTGIWLVRCLINRLIDHLISSHALAPVVCLSLNDLGLPSFAYAFCIYLITESNISAGCRGKPQRGASSAAKGWIILLLLTGGWRCALVLAAASLSTPSRSARKSSTHTYVAVQPPPA